MHRALSGALFLAGAVTLAASDTGSVARAADAGPTAPVTYIGAKQVAAAFAKGAPLVEVDAYKIHASRRERPGMAEVHTLDTDIIYVLDGTATFVTGGEVRDGVTTAPGEIRGTSILGGETRQLAKGDIMVVPNGTPHRFEEVSAPFLYYVVKVTAPVAAANATSVPGPGARALPAPRAEDVDLVRVDPALDAIVPATPTIEKLAEGFQFTEGPVWLPDGALLFSDPNANRIYRWSPADGLSVFKDKSGYEGTDVAAYTQPGSNGLTLDRSGRLVVCEHGNRRVTRLEPGGGLTVLADRFEGHRLNSPNDLVVRTDGTIYFSDPPFGLPKFHDDPRRELRFSGVFRVDPQGAVHLVSQELSGPNGLAFSPDERFLYVTNWDPTRKVVLRYRVDARGDLGTGEVFFDMGAAPEMEALDGIKVDVHGNLYVSGPGGLWILSPAGKHLGTIRAPELAANFTFGDADGRTLYMTARTGLYRMRLLVEGIRPASRLQTAQR